MHYGAEWEWKVRACSSKRICMAGWMLLWKQWGCKIFISTGSVHGSPWPAGRSSGSSICYFPFPLLSLCNGSPPFSLLQASLTTTLFLYISSMDPLFLSLLSSVFFASRPPAGAPSLLFHFGFLAFFIPSPHLSIFFQRFFPSCDLLVHIQRSTVMCPNGTCETNRWLGCTGSVGTLPQATSESLQKWLDTRLDL